MGGGLLTVITRASVCRSLPPTLRISVSPLEETDARIPLTRGRDVPETFDAGEILYNFLLYKPGSYKDGRFNFLCSRVYIHFKRNQ